MSPAAREEILARVRGALHDVPAGERPEDVVIARRYRREVPAPEEGLTARFASRLRDYGSEVRELAEGDVAAHVAEACAQRGLQRLVVPPALPPAWRPDGVELVLDTGLPPAELDAMDGVLSGCALAIAETGTLVLDGRGISGRRAITLVPDHHICVVAAAQVVAAVPEAVRALGTAVRGQRVPVTLVSGPSASSDIELSRVEGVHGPRDLLVLLTH